MSLLSRLFGGKSGAAAEVTPEEYSGYLIFPEPAQDGGQFRVGARIEKDVDGEVKVHHLIRADTIANRDEAVAHSIVKAKQVIDQQGDAIFR